MKLRPAFLSVALLASSCTLGAGEPNHKVMDATGKASVFIPRITVPGQILALRVTVGEIPIHSSVVVRTEDGEVIGTVAPFPVSAHKAGGTYTLPVPARLAAKDTAGLVFKIEKTGEKARAPTKQEVTEWKVVAQ